MVVVVVVLVSVEVSVVALRFGGANVMGVRFLILRGISFILYGGKVGLCTT